MGEGARPPRERGVHVMLCYSIYPPIQAGGAELIVAYLAEGLAARNHRVTVVSTCGPEMEPYPTEQRNGVEIIRFFPKNRYWLFDREGRVGLDKLRWHVKDAWNQACGTRLRQILRKYRPDILHSHGVEGFSPAMWRMAKSQHIPLVHTAHDYYMICPRALLVTRKQSICTAPTLACRARAAWYLRWGSRIDLFCSPSQFLLDMHRSSGLCAKRSAVVHNGIPLPRGPVMRASEGSSEPQPLRLLYAGRLTAEKGVRVAIEAVRRIPPNVPVRLAIAGKGPLESEARAAAAADPRITYAGYVSGEAKARAFSRADCLLLPSLWYENAPVVILEAAAYGLVVIGSRLGAIPEFIHDDVNGLLFEAGSPQSLAGTIALLAQNRWRLSVMRGRAAAALSEYSVDAMVERYVQHYRELAEPSRAAAS